MDSAGQEAAHSLGLLAPQKGSPCDHEPGSAPSPTDLSLGAAALLHDSLWLVPGGGKGAVLGAPGQAMAGAHQSQNLMLVPRVVPLAEQRGGTMELSLPDGRLQPWNWYFAETLLGNPSGLCSLVQGIGGGEGQIKLTLAPLRFQVACQALHILVVS